MKVYQLLARKVKTAKRAKTADARTDAEYDIVKFMHDNAPSGSGFDSGTTLLLEKSSRAKLVFATSFHHMDRMGSYGGWTSHQITIRADFTDDFTMSISGKDKNSIIDYIEDVFFDFINSDLDDQNNCV